MWNKENISKKVDFRGAIKLHILSNHALLHSALVLKGCNYIAPPAIIQQFLFALFFSFLVPLWNTKSKFVPYLFDGCTTWKYIQMLVTAWIKEDANARAPEFPYKNFLWSTRKSRSITVSQKYVKKRGILLT